LFHPGSGEPMLTWINTLYWDKKVKIAVLALATFIAMC
jgi:hypothetical protein